MYLGYQQHTQQLCKTKLCMGLYWSRARPILTITSRSFVKRNVMWNRVVIAAFGQ